MSNVLIVTDRPRDWANPPANAKVVSSRDYLTDPRFTDRHNGNQKLRVFNLCQSYRYQSSGYYVSLLAEARGHRALPDVTTIEDLKSRRLPRALGEELEAQIGRSLAGIESDEFTLSIYFGQNMAKCHERLARALFNLLPAPLLRAKFRRRKDGWQLRSIGPIALAEVGDNHRDFLELAAAGYFARRSIKPKACSVPRYELAILHNPKETEAPSNAAALKRFIRAAGKLGMAAELITADDFGSLAEYDALFIRETTAVNHHSYRFSRQAARDGLVVIDDPVSILRCTNKVYLAELCDRLKLPTPPTMIVHKGNRGEVESQLGLPCVLKQPDSAFSRGVLKCKTTAELASTLDQLLADSDLIVAQGFVPTEYDWRIGVMNGVALFACRYYMAKGHWQIYKRGKDGKILSGDSDTMPVSEAPTAAIALAIKSADAIGDGLYGIDIKQFGEEFILIEVNDNPSVDHGVEDLVLGDELYEQIMAEFLRRLTLRTTRRQQQ